MATLFYFNSLVFLLFQLEILQFAFVGWDILVARVFGFLFRFLDIRFWNFNNFNQYYLRLQLRAWLDMLARRKAVLTHLKSEDIIGKDTSCSGNVGHEQTWDSQIVIERDDKAYLHLTFAMQICLIDRNGPSSLLLGQKEKKSMMI